MESISSADIWQARRVLERVVRKTDIIPASLDSNKDVFLKLENLQLTGSFKVRGAYNKISRLTDEQKEKGVIAASAGNHAQGVALAAAQFGIKATIVMPATAPLAKISATRSYGAEVVLHGSVYDDAYAKAQELQALTGAEFIHPFEDVDVIAGQGTIGLEIMEDVPDADAILVPIGGGGLIAGIALAAKSINPKIKIIGVEAAKAASMKSSIEQGEQVALDSAATIADGIAVKKPGKLNYQIVKEHVHQIVTVSEADIANAVLLLLERFKLVAEGSGAVTVAALLNGCLDLAGQRVVAVISGGNIDVNFLSRIVDRGLAHAGRKTELTTVILDRPGSLQNMLKIISDLGANVVEIHHNRIAAEAELNRARVDLVLETHDHAHLKEIIQQLHQNHYNVRQV